MSLAFVLLDSQCTHEQCRLLVPAICARGSDQAVTLASKTNAVNQAAVLHIPCPRVISSYVSHNGPAVSAYRAPLGDVEVHKTKLPPPKTVGFNLLFACGRGELESYLAGAWTTVLRAVRPRDSWCSCLCTVGVFLSLPWLHRQCLSTLFFFPVFRAYL